MFLIIDLVDYENESEKYVQLEFQTQTTISHLQDRISSAFRILPKFQQITDSNDRRIDLLDGSIEDAGIRENETLTVKHLVSRNWKCLLDCFDLAQQALLEGRIGDLKLHVELAVGQLKYIIRSGILKTFPSYNKFYLKFAAKFSRYMNQNLTYIEFAVHDYFSKIFLDNSDTSPLDIKCEKAERKRSGTQGLLFCRVSRSEALLGKFYLKEHMGLSNYKDADLQKIFVYKLLELIHVGPAVHFISNTHGSCCIGLYIGTKEIVGFRRADSYGFEISDELHAQRDLLRRVLCIGNINGRNHGIDGDGRLSIVDFQIKHHDDSVRVHKYLDDIEIPEENKEFRIRVAINCIASWNLLETFDRANAAIVKQKELFKECSILCRPSQNFDEYFELIKNNLTALVELLK